MGRPFLHPFGGEWCFLDGRPGQEDALCGGTPFQNAAECLLFGFVVVAGALKLYHVGAHDWPIVWAERTEAWMGIPRALAIWREFRRAP